MFNFSDGNSFKEILDRCLARIDDTLDKRQGSIIYDALAPACAELATCYTILDMFADQTYLVSAVGDNLDNLVANYGLIRISAIYAQRLGTFLNTNDEPMEITIGAKFSVPNESGGYNYTVTSTTSTSGTYILTCDTAGTVGNEYFGTILPLQSINNLGTATLGTIYIAGEDEESDDSLRQRAIDKLNETAFGGNIADYKEFMEAQEGVGECLVLPVWDGGGTVKLVVITSSYDIPTSALIDTLQTAVDPTQNQGEGYGKAPIGHVVTVVAPTEYDLDINCIVSVETRYTLESLKDDIENAIKDYILEIQKLWANSSSLIIYISRLIAAVVDVDGIANVSSLTINGSSTDVTIDVTSAGNPYPMAGEIIINES